MFRLSRAPSSNRRRPDILPGPLLHAASTPSPPTPMLRTERVLLSSRAMPPLSARAQVPECASAMHCMRPGPERASVISSSSSFSLFQISRIHVPFGLFEPNRPVFCFPFPAALLRIPRPTSTPPLLPFGVQRKSTSAHLHPDSCRIGPKSNPSCPPSLCSARNPNQCTWYGHLEREGALRAASPCASPANTEAGPSVASEQSYTCVLARPCCVPHSSRARAKGGGIAVEQART
ncbi:uncharacterized protein IWZ02DRAFT_26402 [Phyllosticta citriasiana]|uniref:uncharacterized protein n=1 Tax=Phyllosticta citriasiana TaxID=595635 RepID=UPI0030FD3933